MDGFGGLPVSSTLHEVHADMLEPCMSDKMNLSYGAEWKI
jgi:hypothetical protein